MSSSGRDNAISSMLPPTASCYDVKLRPARWTDPSDLAMVRDWFYPHKIKAKSHAAASAFDPYAGVAVTEDDGTDGDQLSSSARAGVTRNGDGSIEKRTAIERVELYTLHEKSIPHALLATAALVDAQLHYDEGYNVQSLPTMNSFSTKDTMDGQDTKFRISTAAMKSIFAMAFCRFVNGFVDRDVVRSSKALRYTGLVVPSISSSKSNEHDAMNSSSSSDDEAENETDDDDDQAERGGNLDANIKRIPKGSGESSMYKHAITIGMPTTFVDLRHKATHGQSLPDMSELIRKTAEALDWLWDRWWKINARGDPAVAIWELQQWNDALSRYQGEVRAARQRETQEQRQDVIDDMGADPQQVEEEREQWQSVTEHGVTRFVRGKV